eukprot:6175682-Pleurochrysis_carterae.AAC.4
MVPIVSLIVQLRHDAISGRRVFEVPESGICQKILGSSSDLEPVITACDDCLPPPPPPRHIAQSSSRIVMIRARETLARSHRANISDRHASHFIMRKASSFMCVLVVLLSGGAEALRPSAADRIVFAAGLIGLPQLVVSNWGDCRRFDEIYANGQELCETMWGGTANGQAFEYTTDEENAYTMWWFENENPNNLITQRLGKTVPNTCELQYFHKADPSPEGPGFTECHPWHEASCCHDATTDTPEQLRDSYGAGYEWDRCGPISQACERFFVMEACMYECSPNAGLYRRFSDAQVTACAEAGYVNVNYELYAGFPQRVTAGGVLYNCTGDENKWEMYKMPIKASFCDSWFRACAEDLFCGTGDFFSCATTYHQELAFNASQSPPPPPPISDGDDSIPGWAVAVIIIGGVFLLILCIFSMIMVRKERTGEPIFTPMNGTSEKRKTATQASADGVGMQHASGV